MPLGYRAILIIDSRVGHFVHDLQTALERASAEVLVVRDAAGALLHLEKFEFAACLLGHVADAPEACRSLVAELGGIPVVLYGSARDTFAALRPGAAAVPESVPAIVREVGALLGKGGT